MLFDLIFIPVRMTILLAMLALVFGLGLQLDGVPQALVILIFFMPFVWGLGILAAAITLTFRRGAGIVASRSQGSRSSPGSTSPSASCPAG